jgi:GDPmannose 4,6-dehydratase
LITGISGQDGYYLSRLLLARGRTVVGVARAATQLPRLDERLHLRDVDLRDRSALGQLFSDFAFDEVYNLAGQSFGPASWEDPLEACDTLGTAVVALLELIRRSGRPIRLFQASSSELFGYAAESPQRETTPMLPISPYGFAKLLAHRAVSAYRDRHGLFACSGILFNHESPLRSPRFVTRKITLSAARIRLGLDTSVTLGSLAGRRDWGFAGDVAEAMLRMVEADSPDDYVIATGRSHSVRDLCEIAFGHVGLDYREHVVEEESMARRQEFDRLGDASRANAVLGWQPTLTFEDLVTMMVDHDMRTLEAARGA